MSNNKVKLCPLFKLAGTPGFLLFGYSVFNALLARQKDDFTAVDANAVMSAMYAIGCGLYCFFKLRKSYSGIKFTRLTLLHSPLLFFVLYTVLCLISSLWSPYPVLSAYRAAECFALMFLIMATVHELTLNTNEDGIIAWSALYAFLLIAFRFCWNLFNWGDLSDAFYSCQFLSTIFFYFGLFYAPRWWMKWTQIIFAFMAKSVTGYVGMALGMIAFLFGTQKQKIMAIFLYLGIIVAAIYIGPDQLLNKTIFESKGGVMVDGRVDMSKTSGRDAVWENTLNKIANENTWLFGYGFVAGETEFAHETISLGVIGMHNGFLSALVGSGIFGLILFSIFIFQYIKWSFFRGLPL